MAQTAHPDSSQQTWRVVAHASALIQLIGIPSVVGPLAVWLIRRDDPVVEPHARAALNFQLSVLIYFVVGSVVAVFALVTIIGILFALVLVIASALLFLLEIVFAILATLAASRGELYGYPMSLDLIKG